MAVFDGPLDAPFDAATIAAGPVSWLARDASKPQRPDLETWVIHAAPGWSVEYLDAKPEDAARELVKVAVSRLRAPRPVWMAAHLWASAFVERAVGSPFGWDRTLRIGSCGDWYLGPRAELAWESGHGLGAAMTDGDGVRDDLAEGVELP